MYFKFDCTNCGKKLKSPEENVGRKANCPYCHATVVVPSPSMIKKSAKQGRASSSEFDEESEEYEGRAFEQHQSLSEATNVPFLKSGLYAIIGTVVVFGIMFVLKSTYLGVLFLERGWVQYASTFLMVWSGIILVMKQRKLARQKSAMLFDLLPTEISEEITPENLGQFTKHIRNLPADPGESFLITRVLRGLDHFRVRRSNPEVASLIASQGDIDANSVASSYTLLKVFVWAIPILGFIGTVIGISAAVGGFSGGMDNASDISALKESLGKVTGGLSTAFDTTLLALVFSMFIMFPMSSMQKAEDDLLNSIDEYCNENLIKRLNDGGQETDSGGNKKAIQKAINAAMADHHAELQTWNRKLEGIGSTLAESAKKGWTEIHTKLQEQHAQKATQLDGLMTKFVSEQKEAVGQLKSIQQDVGKLQASQAQQAEETRNKIDQNLSNMVSQFEKVMVGLADRTEAVQEQMVESVKKTAETLETQFTGLAKGLESLNRVLTSLGEKQIVIEQKIMPADDPDAALAVVSTSTRTHRKSGWGLFGRRNGK